MKAEYKEDGTRDTDKDDDRNVIACTTIVSKHRFILVKNFLKPFDVLATTLGCV
jgi:hypothetical protein